MTGERQPVHTVYGGAQLFRTGTIAKLGELARRDFGLYAPDAPALASALDLPAALAGEIHERIAGKLSREPLEDYRIDFEDGYGYRSDTEEDGHAESVAGAAAEAIEAGQLPPFFGIRIKPLSEALRGRAVRTLDIFLSTLAAKTGGKLPANFVITLPKITVPEQVSALAELLASSENRLGLRGGSLGMEIMIETPQALLNIPRLVAAGAGRITAAHLGAYDFTAALNVAGSHQRLTHPACDFARMMMQTALAATGIRVSDGATNLIPVPPREAVHRAWKLHYENVRHALVSGIYQGWDLHPAQLPARYAALYVFFLEDLEAASERLRAFIANAARATMVAGVFDDAASGQGLLNFFLRAINCGAIKEDEALPLTGLSMSELRSGSFLEILRNRHG